MPRLGIDLFIELIAPLLRPRELWACGLACRQWLPCLTEPALWAPWCRRLPHAPYRAASLRAEASYAVFADLMRSTACGARYSLRLENGPNTPIQLIGNEDGWRLVLASTAGIPNNAYPGEDTDILDIGANWDTFSLWFQRYEVEEAGALSRLLQRDLAPILHDDAQIRDLGRFLPTHDYEVAAFAVHPVEQRADTAYRNIFVDTPLDLYIKKARGVNPSALGDGTVYRHTLPPHPSRATTHLVIAPIHAAADTAKVQEYERDILAGQRPVALALCIAPPYGAYGADGTNALCGWDDGERELATVRALLASEHTHGHCKESLRRYVEEIVEAGLLTPEWVLTDGGETARARRKALGAGVGAGVRLGLCVILDGHHKLKAAANLGAACTMMCYGLQGTAVTEHQVPQQMQGKAANLYLDAEAIFNAFSPTASAHQ